MGTGAPGIEAEVAPMEGVTLFPMRYFLHLAARPVAMTTPFLRVTAGQPEGAIPETFAPELGELRGVLPYRLTPQLLATGPDHFLRVAERLPPEVSPVIELNCGCPSPNSAGRLAGSSILADPAAFGGVVGGLARALGPRRLAVKMRLGIAADAEFDGLLAQVASAPLARLTVHARTKRDGYAGGARWERVRQAAKAAAAPTAGSGDVVDATTAAAAVAAAPVTWLIGRGALRNPWVFEELRTGRPARLGRQALANALLAFVALHDLWVADPGKLLARIGSGRLPLFCGTDGAAWESLAAALTSLTYGVPSTASAPRSLRVSGATLQRFRYLMSHLAAILPAPLQDRRRLRAATLDDWLAAVWTELAD